MKLRKPHAESVSSGPYESYFEDGATWDMDVYRRMRASRNRGWTVAFICLGLAVLSLICLALLLPLKQFEPYVVTIDKSTGYVEVTRGLLPGPLTQDEAITQSNLVRYVTARETYDPPDQQANYEFVELMSEDQARREFQALWDASNPQNPARTFGYDVEVGVEIKSISFLNHRTASVRFLRKRTEKNITRNTHWVAIVVFRYVERPTRMLERFQNPLGFQVSSYRVDQETLTE